MHNLGVFFSSNLTLSIGGLLDNNLTHNMGPFWVKILTLNMGGPFLVILGRNLTLNMGGRLFR